MVKRHLKRQSAVTTWPIERKGTKFIVRPNPGKEFRLSIPLAIVFKDMLHYCKTTKEVKKILLDKEVIVDGKRRKDHRYSMGVMDVMSIPITGEAFRMLLNRNGKLELVSIDKAESDIKPYKVASITLLKQGLVQLNLFDGRNIRAKKGGEYKVNDTIVLKGSDVSKHIKFDKGAYAVLMGGKHIGSHGAVKSIDRNVVEIETSDGQKITTDKKYVFIVGEDKPLIKVI